MVGILFTSSICCFTSGTRRDTLHTNPIVSHEMGRDRDTATFFYMSKVRTYISIGICRRQLCVFWGLIEEWFIIHCLNYSFFPDIFGFRVLKKTREHNLSPKNQEAQSERIKPGKLHLNCFNHGNTIWMMKANETQSKRIKPEKHNLNC